MRALALLMACTACTFPLATAVTSATHTQRQALADNADCKATAATQSQQPADQARGFLLGLTVAGIAADQRIQRDDQRRIYAACMIARGYTVTPAQD